MATPIEQELNGTPGMLYMESSSTNTGSFSATVTFDISVNPDLAAVEIQNRVKQGGGPPPRRSGAERHQRRETGLQTNS